MSKILDNRSSRILQKLWKKEQLLKKLDDNPFGNNKLDICSTYMSLVPKYSPPLAKGTTKDLPALIAIFEIAVYENVQRAFSKTNSILPI